MEKNNGRSDRAELYYTIHLDEALNIADFNPLVRQAYLETKTIESLKKSTGWLQKEEIW